MQQTIVISAVNLTSGGPLTILRDCLEALSSMVITHNLRVIAIVHDKTLAQYPHIEYIELPKVKKSWGRRLWCEYVTMYRISIQLAPVDIWLSLHDMTPRVKAKLRAVYCHNSTPFYKSRLTDIKLDYKVFLFSLFYKYLYRINIRKNRFLIVQQEWLRSAFAKIYRLDPTQIIVAYPNAKPMAPESIPFSKPFIREGHRITRFFYPALPRVFKNHQVICQAVDILNRRGVTDFQVTMTMDGTENPYAKKIVDRYASLSEIDFVGLIPVTEMPNAYEQTDCLIFPSKLETWGLPLSEFSVYKRPILAADLPYAHEAANGAEYIAFFSPEAPEELADKMEAIIRGENICRPNEEVVHHSPFTKDWTELFELLIKTCSQPVS